MNWSDKERDPRLRLRRRYRTLLIDPPWLHRGGGPKGAAPYPCITVERLLSLAPVIKLIAPPPAHLYLWTTNAFLEPAIYLARVWGFELDNVIVWDKQSLRLGHWFRGCHELLLFCRTHGVIPRRVRNARNIIRETSTRHSAKPAAAYALIERVSPGPRLELFARQKRKGWDVWGNEVTPDTNITLLAKEWSGRPGRRRR